MVVVSELTPSASSIPPNSDVTSVINSPDIPQPALPLHTCTIDPKAPLENGSYSKPQEQPSGHEFFSDTNRPNQQSRTTNSSIHNTDAGSTFTEHPSKFDQSVLHFGIEFTDNTISKSCCNKDDNRTTNEEFPPGFEPGFEFQSRNVPDTCIKPKRQRG
ncbi:hypothetical protein Salat_0158600 [Sesamum alatum]|uniref:Uncharacterized protein n=1 Tax=Sesamum alatum TaxID=300844 RepID=A0AAE2CY06_9LAMI|nr:hypothetical protein Salat_0158600 [Sesamum alatum]